MITDSRDTSWKTPARTSGEDPMQASVLDSRNSAYFILNAIDEACYELDMDGRVVYVNRKTLELWHMSEHHVLGKNIWKLFPETVNTHCYDAIQISALDERKFAEFEYVSAVFHQWISLSATPTKNGCIVIFREIDRIKKAEEETMRLKDELARREKDKYLHLFNSMDQGVQLCEVIRNDEGKAIDIVIHEVNPAWERIMRVKSDTVLQKRVSEWLPHLQDHWLQFIDRAVKSGLPERDGYYVATLDRWYDIYISPLGGNFYMGLLNDTTEQKRHEKNQTLLFDVSKLLSLNTIEDTMDQVGKRLGEHFQITQALFAEISDDNEYLFAAHGWNAPGYPSLKGSYRTRDFLSNVFVEDSLSGRPTIVNDTQTDSRVNAERYKALGAYAFIVIPLIRNNIWRFMLGMVDCKAREWKNEEVELLQEITNRIWERLERGRAEAELRIAMSSLSTQSRFTETTLSSIPDFVYAFNKEKRFAYTNKAMQDLFGLTADQMLGKNFNELDYPTELADRLNNHIELVFKTGTTVEDEVYYTSPIGISAYFQFVWGPVKADDGSVELVVGVSRDTTERRKLENEMEKLVAERTKALAETNQLLAEEHYFLEQVTDKTPDLIYVFDMAEQRFTYMNKRANELIGKSEEYVYAMGPHLFQAILHPDDVRKRIEYMGELSSLEDQEIRSMDFRIWNGKAFRWFRSKDSIFLKEENKVKQIIGLVEDVTYEKLVEQKIDRDDEEVGLN